MGAKKKHGRLRVFQTMRRIFSNISDGTGAVPSLNRLDGQINNNHKIIKIRKIAPKN
jgi:hypothetical protein